MIQSKEFEPLLFEKLASEWNEGPRVDFKQELFKLESDEDKFKFIKLLIAFANISRRTGKNCWILFGVNDKTREIENIKNQTVRKNPPPDSNIFKIQEDYISEPLHTCAENWIGPEMPDFYLRFGELEQDKFVSYLEILPDFPSKPYFLLKPYKGFDKGTVFIRKGSSSLPLTSTEVENLLPCSEAEYLEKSHWQNIIGVHLSGEFLSIQNISPYIEIFTETDPQTPALDLIRQKIKDNTKNLIILGQRGEGKTIFLHRLAYHLAFLNDPITSRQYFGEDENDIKQDKWVKNVSDELEILPTCLIPIYFHLRRTVHSVQNLENQILSHIKKISGKSNIRGLNHLFNIKGTKWLFILDGIDELRNLEEAGPVIHTWLTILPPNVATIISSRPHCMPEIDNLTYIKLKSISIESILHYAELFSSERLEIDAFNEFTDQFRKWLNNNQELLPVISNFRAIYGFLNYVLPEDPNNLNHIDFEEIKIDQKQDFPSYEIINNRELKPPIILSEDLQGDGSSFPDDNNEAKYADNAHNEKMQENLFTFPTRAIAVQVIVNYIRQEEEKRQRDFGNSSKNIKDEAMLGLDKTAWNSNWDKLDLNINKAKKWLNEKTLQWNEIVGFINKSSNPAFIRFSDQLLHHFFAAEHVFYNFEDGESFKIWIKKKKCFISAPTVLNLLNQLRSENGKTFLSLD